LSNHSVDGFQKPLGLFLQLFCGQVLDPLTLEKFIGDIQQRQNHEVHGGNNLRALLDLPHLFVDKVRKLFDISPVPVTSYAVLPTEKSDLNRFGRFGQAVIKTQDLVGLILFQVNASSFSMIRSSFPLADR